MIVRGQFHPCTHVQIIIKRNIICIASFKGLISD